MSLVTFGGVFQYPSQMWGVSTLSGANDTINSTGDRIHVIGQIMLENGSSGGSKTISSAGGKLHWNAGSSMTFANAGTTLRLGVQDLDTTSSGRGDGTFDVSADLVGGTDTLAVNTGYATPMETGTKTISQGDFVAIAINMISRGGSDSVTTIKWTDVDIDTSPWPGMTTSSTHVSTTGHPNMMLEFDDGTFGWMARTMLVKTSSTIAFNVNTGTADEYGNLVQVQAPVSVAGVVVDLSASTSADSEIILYSDALGTPVVVEALTVDATAFSSAGQLSFLFTESHTLLPGVNYAITIRPTTTNSYTLSYTDVHNADHWRNTTGSMDVYAVRRLDNTGAFSDYNGGTAKTRRLHFNMLLDKVHNNTGRASSQIGI